MCSNNKKLTIADLCDDLLCQIFDHLSVGEVLDIQTVNKNFYRCARKWLATVDELTITDDSIYLEKTLVKRSQGYVELSPPHGQTFVWLLDQILAVCTGIRTVDFMPGSITAKELVQVISRCPDINRFLLSLSRTPFDDHDWTRLVQLVKHCHIKLEVYCSQSTHCVRDDHLEQLFTKATGIESVSFCDAPDSVLKTIDWLDRSATIKVEGLFHPEPVDERVREIIAQRVNDLNISGEEFQALSIRRFLNLTQLEISSHEVDPLVFKKMDFPRLEFLELNEDEDNLLISSFFAAVHRLDRLNKLELTSDGTIQLSEVLAKTPNITELSIRWRCFLSTKISAFKELLKYLSGQSSATRIQALFVTLDVTQLEANDYAKLANCVGRFSRRKPGIKLKIFFWDFNN